MTIYSAIWRFKIRIQTAADWINTETRHSQTPAAWSMALSTAPYTASYLQ